MIVGPEDQPIVARELDAMVCWMSQAPLRPGARYALRHTTRDARAIVDQLECRVDVDTLEHEAADELDLNEIGRVRLRASTPLDGRPLSPQPHAREASSSSTRRLTTPSAAGMILAAT